MDWDTLIQDADAVLCEVTGPLRPPCERAVELMISCLRGGGQVLACGNGGSAADAQHFVAELVNRFLLERAPYASVALTTDSSVMTSVGNDYSYDEIFAKQVQAIGRRGDVLLAISTSGNAANVCRAVETARDAGIVTLALTGGTGGRLATLADHVLSISCTTHVPRIQEGHGLIIHLLCEMVEETLR